MLHDLHGVEDTVNAKIGMNIGFTKGFTDYFIDLVY